MIACRLKVTVRNQDMPTVVRVKDLSFAVLPTKEVTLCFKIGSQVYAGEPRRIYLAEGDPLVEVHVDFDDVSRIAMHEFVRNFMSDLSWRLSE